MAKGNKPKPTTPPSIGSTGFIQQDDWNRIEENARREAHKEMNKASGAAPKVHKNKKAYHRHDKHKGKGYE